MDPAPPNPSPTLWRYLTREGREVELVNLRAAALPGFVTGTRKDNGEEWTVEAGKLKPAQPA